MNNKSHTLIFGLTADPIHKGHEQVIHNSFSYANHNNLSIKRFLLVPTYEPNLIANKQQPNTAFEHRFEMCQIVADDMRSKFNYPIQVSDIEKQLFESNKQKSYSYDTLKAIDAQNKLFVLSADHFAGRWPKFRKWHMWQALVKENGLLIHQRPGHNINKKFIDKIKQNKVSVYAVDKLPLIEVSSTQIRHSLYNRETLNNNLLSQKIMQYITKKELYCRK